MFSIQNFKDKCHENNGKFAKTHATQEMLKKPKGILERTKGILPKNSTYRMIEPLSVLQKNYKIARTVQGFQAKKKTCSPGGGPLGWAKNVQKS